MIGKLRRKFIIINMVLMTAMLLVIFGLVYHFTKMELENTATAALRSAAATLQFRPGRPGTLDPQTPERYFTLELTPWGELIVTGSEAFDLSDQELLLEIYTLAQNQQSETGILEEYALRFYRATGITGSRFAFADITSERYTLNNLVENCIIIGAVAFVGLLIISILLARWAVKPVESAWQQQRQFVADASHELKTPLTVILTNAELLHSPEYAPEEKRRFADSILAMSRQMRALVESLLDLARADNGQVMASRKELDYSRLVEDAVLPFEPVYFEQGLSLVSHVEPGIRVMGSEPHLRQVVEILLDNGRKYSAPGGEAVLTLTGCGRGKSLLMVSTPGAMLTPEQCRDIFKRFYRVDEARTGSGSYGLGLSIAERIVSEHRGKIWAEGRDGRNFFYVQLPE